MCYKSPGPRCSNHATKLMKAAESARDANPSPENEARYEQAVDEWHLTPAGIAALKEDAAAASAEGDREEAATLTAKAEQKQAERKEAIAAYKAANDPDAEPASSTAGYTELGSYVRSFHKAPTAEHGTALHEVGDLYGSDYLTHPERYTPDGSSDTELVRQLRKAKDNPNALITIYRALPKAHTHINRGDWVALSHRYAKHHLESCLDDNHHIVKEQVPAHTIWSEGNDLTEWGYDGEMVETDPAKAATTPAPAPVLVKAHPASDLASTYADLDYWMSSGDPEARAAVAGNPSAHPALLRKASKDAEEEVRLAAALNERTPSDALLTLANDTSEEVREAVSANPNTPTHLLALLNR